MIVQGITIDPPNATDLDDAVWAEETAGGYAVTVSVAAVGRALSRYHPAAEAARRQGFTRYHSDFVRHMLPRYLIGRLSLHEGQPRPVIAVRTHLNPDFSLAPAGSEFHRATLISTARLTYRAAAELAAGQGERAELRDRVRLLALVAQGLLARRRDEGGLVLYDLNQGWALTEEGHLKKLAAVESNLGYVIVQELMILANGAVARFFARAGAACLYRNHSASRPGKNPRPVHLAEELGAALAGAGEESTAARVRALIKRYRLEMMRARYEPDLRGHFGLNVPAYLHFTSPIRRYCDLVNHWAMEEYLTRGRRRAFSGAWLQETAGRINDLSDAERLLTKQYLKGRAAEQALRRIMKMEVADLKTLGDAEVYRMIKVTLDAGELPEEFVAFLGDRARLGLMPDKDWLVVLLKSAPESLSWRVVRGALLAEMLTGADAARPARLLAMAESVLRWPAARYSVREEKEREPWTAHSAYYFASAHQTIPAELAPAGVSTEVAGPEVWATSKKAARQRAALGLLYLLAGGVPPEGFSAPPPPRTAENGGQAATAPPGPPGGPAQREATLADVADQIAGGDYVSALTNYAAKRKDRQPGYQMARWPLEGEPFRCRAHYAAVGATREGASMESKKAAKQEAARLLLEAIREAREGAREEEALAEA